MIASKHTTLICKRNGMDQNERCASNDNNNRHLKIELNLKILFSHARRDDTQDSLGGNIKSTNDAKIS